MTMGIPVKLDTNKQVILQEVLLKKTETKPVIQCLFLWQKLFGSGYYLTQHDCTTRCFDFGKNRTVHLGAKRSQ